MNINQPLVSILTPTYNHARFIKNCIDSVIGQHYPKWEMIIIDDGSTDETRAIAKSFKDKRIRYFKQENIGIWRLKETYNFALSHAKGSCIAILEGDDCWPADRLSTQVPFFAERTEVLCYGRFLKIDENANLLNSSKINSVENVVVQTTEQILCGLLAGRLTIMPVTALIRRDALEAIGGFQQPAYYPAVEHPTWLSLCQKGNFIYSDHVLGYWRRHIGQASGDLGLQLCEGLLNYNVEFFDALSPAVQQKIGYTRKQLLQRKRRRLAAAHFSKGRYQLLASDSGGATVSFHFALKHGDSQTKIKAMVGLLALKTGIDIEGFIGLTGRDRYR